MFREVLKEIGDPANLQFDMRRIVREYANTAGPDDHEHVRIVRDREAHERARTIGPVITQQTTTLAAHIDARHCARHCVETSRENKNVKFLHARCCANTFGHNFDDGVFAKIDKRDVVAVERFEIAVVENGSLAADRIILRAQRIGNLGIDDCSAHHFTEQFDGHFIGVHVFRSVGPDARCVEPLFFKRGNTFFFRAFENELVRVSKRENCCACCVRSCQRRCVLLRANFAITRLHLGLMFGCQWSVLRRPGKRRRALKHGEMSCDLCQFWDDLHP